MHSVRKATDEQPLVAQLAGELDCLFGELPCGGDVKLDAEQDNSPD
jgi:hypothetical protein